MEAKRIKERKQIIVHLDAVVLYYETKAALYIHENTTTFPHTFHDHRFCRGTAFHDFDALT